MCGKQYPNPYVNQIFWQIFLTISQSISLIGSIGISWKKYQSFKANQNRVQEIHITLEDQIQNQDTNNNIEHRQFNNQGQSKSNPIFEKLFKSSTSGMGHGCQSPDMTLAFALSHI